MHPLEARNADPQSPICFSSFAVKHSREILIILLNCNRTLLQGFGCLADGLTYVHSHTMRHKDIKPQDILVHHGRIIFTDFEICSRRKQSSHHDYWYGRSVNERYCAPKVIKHLLRNRNSDILSLRCVFLRNTSRSDPLC
ncbi:hypothetical protein DE146DRAFT_107807 [Phaeosphaeria sp. MPI-PUGE-AT-0046c]|nr:hypothetical protein DE146DRAFT_107807 [Phaeosphaeria sp. MPI-PUGE-AT-0046c]